MIGNGTGLIWFGDSSLLSIAPGEKASSRSPKTGGSSLIGFGSNSFLMQNACTPGAAQAQALKLKEAESQGRGEDVRKAEKSTVSSSLRLKLLQGSLPTRQPTI